MFKNEQGMTQHVKSVHAKKEWICHLLLNNVKVSLYLWTHIFNPQSSQAAESAKAMYGKCWSQAVPVQSKQQ